MVRCRSWRLMAASECVWGFSSRGRRGGREREGDGPFHTERACANEESAMAGRLSELRRESDEARSGRSDDDEMETERLARLSRSSVSTSTPCCAVCVLVGYSNSSCAHPCSTRSSARSPSPARSSSRPPLRGLSASVCCSAWDRRFTACLCFSLARCAALSCAATARASSPPSSPPLAPA